MLNHRARIDTTYHGIRQEENGVLSYFVEMLTAKGFGPRIRKAVFEHQAKLGERYTDKDFGRDVGMAERGKPWGGSTVGEWVAERNEPSIATFKAMSYVTGKSIMWLMGIDELVLTPSSLRASQQEPPRDVRVSDEEIAEAHRETDKKRSAENAKTAGGAKRGRKR